MIDTEQDLLDEDGYPTDYVLSLISKWGIHEDEKFSDLMDLIQGIWMFSDYFSRDEVSPNLYYLSTGGWSGNESIISALQDNRLFWCICWLSSRRGGHYIFDIKEGS